MTKLFPSSRTRSENFYVYDLQALQYLLNMNVDILNAAKWPLKAEDFVEMVNTVDAKPKTELYKLIEKCFADKNSDYR